MDSVIPYNIAHTQARTRTHTQTQAHNAMIPFHILKGSSRRRPDANISAEPKTENEKDGIAKG